LADKNFIANDLAPRFGNTQHLDTSYSGVYISNLFGKRLVMCRTKAGDYGRGGNRNQ